MPLSAIIWGEAVSHTGGTDTPSIIANCVLAVSVPLSLSACIYLHLTQGTGKETEFAIECLRIGIKMIVLAPWIFFIVSVGFR